MVTFYGPLNVWGKAQGFCVNWISVEPHHSNKNLYYIVPSRKKALNYDIFRINFDNQNLIGVKFVPKSMSDYSFL